MAAHETAIRVAFVVAVSQNGVIGRDGGLPWRIPSDLKTFRRMTFGKPVVMGRKTFASIGKPLDGRANIVVSRQSDFAPEGVDVAADLGCALARARQLAAHGDADEICVIGGAQVYAAARSKADVIYLTRVEAHINGDTYFPEPEPDLWCRVARQAIDPDPRDAYPVTLETYHRHNATGGSELT